MVFSPEENCSYTLVPTNYSPGHIRYLAKLSPEGRLIKKIRLYQPIPAVDAGITYQLKVIDGKLMYHRAPGDSRRGHCHLGQY